MISVNNSEYLLFLANYFKIDPQLIIQRSIDHHIILPSDSSDTITSKLQSRIGYQRRLLEPLSCALTKTSPFDSIAYVLKILSFDKHYSLLIADQHNIFKLLYFKKDQKNTLEITESSIIKLDSCFSKDSTLMTNQPPKTLWFYDFPEIFTVREFHIDNLPECIYDESYTRTTNLVHIIGFFLVVTRNDKVFCYIHSKELQIRVIPFKREEINTDFSTKLVRITYCELEFGPDAFQLKLTEFSEFILLSPLPFILPSIKFNILLRFEYPSQRMSLIELTEKSVAATKLRLAVADYCDGSWKFFGYDSSMAVCLTVFDSHFGDHLSNSISDDSFFFIDGIYKHGKHFYLRERLENIQLITIEDEDDITIPISRPDQIDDEKLVIIEFYVTEIIEKTYLSNENKQEKYEKLKGLSFNVPITINNYNKSFFQRILVGQSYRIFFLKSKFFNGNLYFIMDKDSFLKINSH